MGIAIGFCMRELLLLYMAGRVRQTNSQRWHRAGQAAGVGNYSPVAPAEELLDRIRSEGLATVAADAEMDPHDLLMQLLRRSLF